MTSLGLAGGLNCSEAALVTSERKRCSDEGGEPGNSAGLRLDFGVTSGLRVLILPPSAELFSALSVATAVQWHLSVPGPFDALRFSAVGPSSSQNGSQDPLPCRHKPAFTRRAETVAHGDIVDAYFP